MKNISIPIEIKEALECFKDDTQSRSVDKAVNLLLDEFDEVGEPAESRGKININLNDETYSRLLRYKLYPTESLGSVIFRLIREHNRRNRLSRNTSTSDWAYDY